jgi:hypothetical protein
MKLHQFILVRFTLMLSACSPATTTRVTELTTPTAAPHNPSVADILRHPPVPGATVEVDAYFNGAWGFLFMGLAVLLLTSWTLPQWLYLSGRRRFQRALREGPFRLYRFIRFVAHAEDQCYIPNTTLRING